jgi:putative component of toxin-antitoxin plasmid stabilization module
VNSSNGLQIRLPGDVAGNTELVAVRGVAIGPGVRVYINQQKNKVRKADIEGIWMR